MKKIKLLIFLIALISVSINAQTCSVEQNTITNGTMGKKTDKAVFIGQSFTACKTGKLTKVSFRIGGGNEVKNIELRVFADQKIAQQPLFKKEIILPTPAAPMTNFEDFIINLSSDVFQVEEGKTYTIGFFKAKSDVKKLLRFKSDNKNSYKEGSLVANSKVPGGQKQNKDVDMVFSFTIE